MTEFERNLLNRLIQDKVITEDIAIVAEQMQIEKGGRIDTNLLDIRAVDENTVLRYLEATSKMKVVPLEKVENISKDIIALLPARLAIRYRLIPFSIEHNSISLIISDPTDISLLEEISFLLGLDVKPYIAPDLWIEHLLCKHYKIEPNKRYEDLFESIRNNRFEVKAAESIKKDAQKTTPSQTSEQSISKEVEKKVEIAQPSKGQESISQQLPIREIDTEITKPYTYSREEALEDIKGIKNRDAIMFFALKYAYQYFDFCAILIFQKDKIRGFNFLGPDRDIEEDFKTLELTVSDEMVFKLVKDTGAHFLGTMPLSGNNEIFIKRLKRPFPPNVLVVPISIAGKTIGVFYADNGESLVRGEDVPHILTFFHIVSSQLQELIRFLKFNKPPYEVKFISKADRKSPENTDSAKIIEIVTNRQEVASVSNISIPSNTEANNIEFAQPKLPEREPQPSPIQTKDSEANALSEDIVNELSQYVEPTQTETVASPVEVKKEEPPTEQKREELAQKEEEYRINLLLDTLEQSPNAINSPAYDELISIKDKALPYIAKRFPGKLKIDLLMQTSSDISDVEEHSNLIQLIVGIGNEAIPHIAPLTKHSNHTIRFYAVFIFSKLRFQEAIPYLLDAIFDTSPKISLVAIEVLNRYRGFQKFSIVLSRLRSELTSSDVEKARIAALSLGQFKDTESIPQLIKLLSSKSEGVRDAALSALRDICKEDLGYDSKAWQKWWQRHQKIPRVLWMIDGLNHKDENIRYLSIEELKEITGEFFGYFYDAPKKERERSVDRWKEWWKSEGEKRFKEPNK